MAYLGTLLLHCRRYLMIRDQILNGFHFSQLSVVLEDEPPAGRPRLGSSTQAVSGAPSPNKSTSQPPISTLARLKSLHLLDPPVEGLEAPISPVPLPPGVVCIDNFDDGNLVYGPSIIAYLRQREVDFQRSVVKGCSFIFLNSGATHDGR